MFGWQFATMNCTQDPGYCFRAGVTSLGVGSEYAFRLEALFPGGFWVPSHERDERIAESKEEDQPRFDRFIEDPSVYQKEG